MGSWRQVAFRLILLLGLLTSSVGFAFTERFVIAIGNNNGLGDEPTLQFAERDAQLFRDVMVEIGWAEPTNTTLLAGRSLSAIRNFMSGLRARLSVQSEVILFFSGHASQEGLHLDNEVWAWSEIRATFDSLSARLVVAMFDACQSGAIFSTKGLQRGPRLTLSAEQLTSKGKYLIASSGANELSYESTLIGGSPFALHLRTALRGSADADNNGAVSLSELYQYVRGRTSASTVSADGGPQHPQYQSKLTGASEFEIPYRTDDRRLVVTPTTDSDCYLLDSTEQRVVADLRTVTETYYPIARGHYVVKCVSSKRVKVAPLWVRDKDVSLEELKFEVSAKSQQLVKGKTGRITNSIEVTAGFYYPFLLRPSAAVSFAYRRSRTGFVVAPRLLFARQSSTLSLALGADIAALKYLEIELGAAVGFQYSWLTLPHVASAVLAPYVGASIGRFGWFRPVARVELLTSFQFKAGVLPATALLFTVGSQFEFHTNDK